LPKTAVLYFTHLLTEAMIERVLAFKDQLKSPNYEFILLFDESLTPPLEIPGITVHRFTLRTIMEMKFPMMLTNRLPAIVPCNVDLPLIHFHLARPNYDYYWVIEYDVRFTGNWRRFFDAFGSSRADLLATNVQRFRDNPSWAWWKSLRHENQPVPADYLVRAFFPIYRLSGHACRILTEEYRRGWLGNYEVKLPTVLSQNRCRLEDIGGEGEFVAAGNENRFYVGEDSRTGQEPTFRWRPAMREPGGTPDTLWHPVKDEGDVDWNAG